MKSKTIELLLRHYTGIVEALKLAKEEAKIEEERIIIKKLSEVEIRNIAD